MSSLVRAGRRDPEGGVGPATIDPATDVVILGLRHSGAALLRRLSRNGHVVCGITADTSDDGLHSRHGVRLICPEPLRDFDAWVAFMASVGASCASRPAVLATTDAFVLALDRAAGRLEDEFRLDEFGSGVKTSLTVKATTFDLARQHGFPIPFTREIRGCDDLEAFCQVSRWPALIKPNLALEWRTADATRLLGYRKVVVARNADELMAAYVMVKPLTPIVIAQEVIMGPDTNHIAWAGHAGRDGRIRGRLVARRLRVLPAHYGSSTYVELVDAPEIESLCEGFMRAIGYRGICEIELKIDERDGRPKLIEANPRSVPWDAVGARVGVDLAREAVAALFGEEPEPRRPTDFSLKWVSLLRDIRAFHQAHAEGALTFRAWAGSLRPPLMIDDFPWSSDFPYAWANLRSLAGMIVAALRRKPPPQQESF